MGEMIGLFLILAACVFVGWTARDLYERRRVPKHPAGRRPVRLLPNTDLRLYDPDGVP